MKKFLTFEQFDPSTIITKKLIKALHEGVKLIKIDSSLNEASNVKSFAQEEIERVVRHARSKGDTAIIEDFVPEILALVDKFGNSGQSGGSAPYTAGAIVEALKKLLMFQPISPVTNEAADWFEPMDGMFQNKRCYGLFKESQDSKPYYLDAMIWRTPKGATYSGSAWHGSERLRSRQYVKTWPFEPKTFIVDVDEHEVAPDDWEFYVKDAKQLQEVFDYYEKF